MATALKRIVLGHRLSSSKLEHQLLPKSLALPVFASDQLSSVAYATENMMLVLMLAGAAALSLMVPLAAGISALLVIVIVSYRQTARAYPGGGGSYIVSRENLGTLAGLTAAAAIQASYVLTVSVSVTAGTIAITSAVPSWARYRVSLAIGFILLIMLANLRGVKEAGRLFAIPTYGFVAMVFATLAIGLARCISECPRASTADLQLEGGATLAVFLALRAFSSGATALTGVEAIADGVQAFRRPQSKNAAATLAIMGSLSIPMFLGITILARLLHVRVNEEIALTKSVLAQIGETIFGGGLPFLLLQGLTAAILVLAANTAYQDFPRLSAILARDRFMPSQFKNRGDRLVFSNGIIVLSALAALLVWLFDARLSALLHLYVIGVFIAITLSQAGMVRRWLRLRAEGWRRGIAINGTGAAATGTVMVVVALTQFSEGAWMVLAAVPVIVSLFLAIHRHYVSVAAELRRGRMSVRDEAQNRFILLVPDVGLATSDAVAYLRAVRPERLTPLYLGEPEGFRKAEERWLSVAPRLGRLEMLPRNGGGTARALREYLRSLPREQNEFLTVVVPETIESHSLFRLMRRRGSFWLKASLLFEPGVVVTDVPLVPEEHIAAAVHAERPVEPERNVVLVPVSGVHDATIRAIVYAKSLHPAEFEAIYFGGDPEDERRIVQEWAEQGVDVQLSIVEAPFRDLGEPLLAEVRSHTSRQDTVVTVVLPEFVVRRWWEHVLHNQTALYFKRILLFEPKVVVTSVPFRI